jgi:hypothetical protein
MTADPLELVLRLVAEGRLTAEEAAPILAALDARDALGTAPGEARSRYGPPGDDDSTRGASVLRIEVRDHGRQVVNLRLPIAAGRFALDSVPGLSGDQVDRVREALRSGRTGPLLEVDDHGDGVRISLE